MRRKSRYDLDGGRFEHEDQMTVVVYVIAAVVVALAVGLTILVIWLVR
jgi:hypothetical protein